MNFNYSAQSLSKGEKKLQRFLEILPGLASWGSLIGILVLSFHKPVAAAVIIIVFDLYWLFRLFYTTIFLVLSYGLLSSESQTKWMKELDAIETRRVGDISNRSRRKNFEWLLKNNVPLPSMADIWHLVIIPVVKETEEIVEPGIQSLCRQTFPAKKILVLLALEERASEKVKQGARRIAERYADHFLDFFVIVHPDGIPGEMRVKGANTTYAAKAANDYFKKKGISTDNIIASCFDADTVVSTEYFACLTYHFMTCEDRARASFQPIPLYHNNLWEAPGFSRVLETASSFFVMIEVTDSQKLVTFSSHSMSFKALVEVGYWPVDMISDDSAIFWKCYIHYDGDYQVIPMYVTVSMDMVAAKNWWETAVSVYKQKRRWAWGVENFPLVTRAFLRADAIPLVTRVKHLFKMFEGHVAWATWAFLLTFVGWLPVLFASKQFSRAVLYYSSQRITGIIFNLSFLSFIVSTALSLFLLPRKKIKRSFIKKIGFACEWLFVPLIATFFGALPALDTQTRMMFGRSLGFWVTDKKRKKSSRPHPRIVPLKTRPSIKKF